MVPVGRVGGAEKEAEVAQGTGVTVGEPEKVELLEAAGLKPDGRRDTGLKVDVAVGFGFREAAAGAKRRAADQLLGPDAAGGAFLEVAADDAGSGCAVVNDAGALVCGDASRRTAGRSASCLPSFLLPGAMKLVPAKRDMLSVR